VFLSFIPCFLILLNCERVLLLLGQDPAASRYAQEYTYYMIVAMFFHSQFDATRQYLNSLHLSVWVTVTMTSTSIIHIFWCYLMVVRLDLDVAGIGIATMISYTWNFVVITIICKFNKSLKESFFWITSESIREGVLDYLKISVPSLIILLLEWGAFEVLALTASAISVDATGAQIIALNLFIVLMMVPWGSH
jgi:multidrug resistance protein, MATE family